jgi:hypothetical protein
MAGRSTAAEPDFPVAESRTINGVVYRCFEKDGPGWADVGHYVVACRARVVEAALAQQRAQTLALDVRALETSVAAWRKTAEAEKTRAQNLETILIEERRTEVKRLYWQKVRDIGIVATVLLGVVVSVSVGVSR